MLKTDSAVSRFRNTASQPIVLSAGIEIVGRGKGKVKCKYVSWVSGFQLKVMHNISKLLQ